MDKKNLIIKLFKSLRGEKEFNHFLFTASLAFWAQHQTSAIISRVKLIGKFHTQLDKNNHFLFYLIILLTGTNNCSNSQLKHFLHLGSYN
jgi:hypothetical protein